MTTIYTIQGRDVVLGMLSPSGWPLSAAVVDALRECGGNVSVELPGPSPRELCCLCFYREPHDGHMLADGNSGRRWIAFVEPSAHDAGCPVAPVTAVHGGMRLWPASVKGEPWVYMPDRLAWRGHKALPEVWPNALRQSLNAWMPGWRDAVLHAFFSPPTPHQPSGDRAAWEAARARKGYR